MAKRAARWLKPKSSEKSNFSLKIDKGIADKWSALEQRLEASGHTVNRAEVIEEMLTDAIEEITSELDVKDKARPAPIGD